MIFINLSREHMMSNRAQHVKIYFHFSLFKLILFLLCKGVTELKLHCFQKELFPSVLTCRLVDSTMLKTKPQITSYCSYK